jgi:tetratricopeptide (TPR) repeat protein
MDSDDEHAAVAALKRAVLLNLALALQRQGEHAEALRRLGALLLADGDDVKALWRRSVSLLATHEHDAARRDLLRVYALDPTLAGECEAQLRRVDAREEAALGKEKKVTSAMLSDPVGEEYMDEDSRLAEAMVRDHRVAEAVVKASPSTVSM